MPIICKYSIKINQDRLNKIIKTVHLKAINNLKLDKKLNSIKEVVLNRTEEYINQHRRRPAEAYKTHLIDVLRETSFIEKIDNYNYRLGIGKKDVLDRKIPYWYVLNYGGIPPDWEGNQFLGTFADGAPRKGGGGNLWIEGGRDERGIHLMRPKKPIPPMHFLNFMSQEFVREIRKFEVKIKK